jgi:hypothetical protein
MKKITFYLLLLFGLFTTPLFAQWQRITYPKGGNIKFLVEDQSAIYAATPAQIFKSTDGGAQWVPLPKSTIIPDDMVDFQVSNGNFYCMVEPYQKFYKSSDFGKNWSQIPTAASIQLYQFLVLGDTLIIKDGGEEVWSSINAGLTWTKAKYNNTDLPAGGVLKREKDVVFYQNYDYLYHSVDRGVTWKLKLSPFDLNVQSITTDFICFVGFYGELIFTQNDYSNPEYITTNFFRRGDDRYAKFILGSKDTLYNISTYRTINNTGCANELYMSLDQGKNWILKMELFFDVYDIVQIENSYLLATSDGLWRSDRNFTNISPIDQEIPSGSAFSFSHYKQFPSLLAYQKIFRIDPTTRTYALDGDVTSSNPCYPYFTSSKRRTVWYDNDGAEYIYDNKLDKKEAVEDYKKFTFLGSPGAIWGVDYLNKEILVWKDDSEVPKSVKVASFHTDSIKYLHIYDTYEDHVWVRVNTFNYLMDTDLNPVAAFQPQPFYCLNPNYMDSYFDGEDFYAYCPGNPLKYNVQDDQVKTYSPRNAGTTSFEVLDAITDAQTYKNYHFVADKTQVYFSTDGSENFFPIYPNLPSELIRIKEIEIVNDTIWVNAPPYLYFMPIQNYWNDQPDGEPAIKIIGTPNPSSSDLRLTADKAILLPFNLQILDITGKSVRTFQLAPGRNWELNLQDLPASTYILRVSGTFAQLSIKWVKHQ